MLDYTDVHFRSSGDMFIVVASLTSVSGKDKLQQRGLEVVHILEQLLCTCLTDMFVLHNKLLIQKYKFYVQLYCI